MFTIRPVTTRPVLTRVATGLLLPALVLLGACTDDDDDPPTTTTSSSVAGTSPSSAPSGTSTTTPPPPQVTGVIATTGGGSGETVITWPPLPDSANVGAYKVYKRKANGTQLPPAAVPSSTPPIEPGRLGVVDAPDTGPWPTTDPDPGPRCYKVSAVSTIGVEGPQSAEVCASPVGG